ncbi:MAG: putative bifunctional diguanylate cyclase/phosphodiesterase [Acidimicrobiia bacterium]
MTWAPTDRRERALPVLIAAAVVASTVVAGAAPALVTGAAVSVVLAAKALRSARPEAVLGGQLVPVSIAVALLAVSGAGVGTGPATQLGAPLVALAAYPFLGRALLSLVRARRQIRDADILVEAALVATAVGIVLYVATSDWRSLTFTSTWGDAGSVAATMLVGLDVALLVIGGRTLSSAEARRGSLGWLHLAVGLLLGAHLSQQVQSLTDTGSAMWVSALAALGLAAVGAAALHPSAQAEPTEPVADLNPFSTAHAAVVVVALLATPGAVAVQTVRGVATSATVATGAVLSGIVLASYLVQLLHDRADVEHRATHDSLTRLPNRTLLIDRLERSIAHAERTGRSVGLLFLDLDRFKDVNDTYGHAAGDALLQQVAERMQSCVRFEDTVARMSGDEFVVLLPHLNDPNEVLLVADRLLQAMGDPFAVGGERVLVAASMGVTVYPEDGVAAEDLLARADAAMYRAKEVVGSRWQVYNADLATEALERMHLEASLLDALAEGELVLHYQPIVDARTGLTTGAEALVRWQHPERGLLSPAEFIPVAERSDLIVLVGDQVVTEACRELRRWQDAGITGASISVNVAARHFGHDLVSTVTSALRETGADPRSLIIELTESTIVDNLDSVARVLDELRRLGVRSAIDDFGTGYTSLQYLSVLPVASLKIDRSFIQGMTPSDAAIVGATIAMGHSLGLRITAEGVETDDQQQFLVEQGCDHLQGYLLGRPMPAADILRRLASERGAMPDMTRTVAHPAEGTLGSSRVAMAFD